MFQKNEINFTLWALLIFLFGSSAVWSQFIETPCSFSSMCSCQKFINSYDQSEIHTASCVNIPFFDVPDLRNMKFGTLEIIKSSISVLDYNSFVNVNVDSLRLISNKITYVHPTTFSSLRRLTSLDLSENELMEIPIEAVGYLNNIEWLNLSSNHIISTKVNWEKLNRLITLDLSNNDITELDPYFLMKMTKLESINLNNNYITHLEQFSMPTSLKILSLSHNLIRVFPSALINDLKHISEIYLRNNLIEHMPLYHFQGMNLKVLDLGENNIKSLERIFEGRLPIENLFLDFNDITEIEEDKFIGLKCKKIVLANNKINKTDDHAFRDLENYLEYLDLSGNKLTKIDKVFDQLKRLTYLNLENNRIKRLSNEAFFNSGLSMNWLSLANNYLEKVPNKTLSYLKNLKHIDFSYNYINKVEIHDFDDWGDNLETLIITYNTKLEFSKNAFDKLKKLKELNLSFMNGNVLSKLNLKELTSLQSLELGFDYLKDFPENELKSLRELTWLALDHNGISELKNTSLNYFEKLKFVNLEWNSISEIPTDFFNSNLNKHLIDIRLSYNSISTIQRNAFLNFFELESISLYENKLEKLKTESFKNLRKLTTVIASRNYLSQIGTKAFSNLPNLENLDLKFNILKSFSISSFDNCTNNNNPLTLDLSYNKIQALHDYEISNPRPIHIKILDLSNNLLDDVPATFLFRISGSLKQLNLGNNKILIIKRDQFKNFFNLEKLILSHNEISVIEPNAFMGINRLQWLDVSGNNIQKLEPQQFNDFISLRWLYLSQNRLTTLPNRLFANTKIEHLSLSNNQFTTLPSLSDISETLRNLELNGNVIENIDSKILTEISYITHLNLCKNRLTNLPQDMFIMTTNLIKLSLCDNVIYSDNFQIIFNPLNSLRFLDMSKSLLSVIPNSPSFSNLTYYMLSRNNIHRIDTEQLRFMPNLRKIDLGNNLIEMLNNINWQVTPNLDELDISNNHIGNLTKESFQGLQNLKTLNLMRNDKLQRFDSDTLHASKFIRTLKVPIWNSIQTYKFKISDILKNLQYLENLYVNVTKSSLEKNLLNGHYTKRFKYLQITGTGLTKLESASLSTFSNTPEITIRFVNTAINVIPRLYFSPFYSSKLKVEFINNRNRQLTFFGAGIFYASYMNGLIYSGTRYIKGGINVLSPVKCDCNTQFLQEFLRRYSREILKVERQSIENSIELMEQLKPSLCISSRSDKRLDILKTAIIVGDCYTPSQGTKFNFSYLLILISLIISFRI